MLQVQTATTILGPPPREKRVEVRTSFCHFLYSNSNFYRGGRKQHDEQAFEPKPRGEKPNAL